MGHDLFNVVRIITVGIGFLDIGMCFAVFQLYLRAYNLGGPEKPVPLHQIARTLPRHILFVSLAHMMMILAICGVIMGRIGENFTLWPTPIAIVAFSISMTGLYQMLKFQNARIDLIRGTTTVTGRREDLGTQRQ